MKTCFGEVYKANIGIDAQVNVTVGTIEISQSWRQPLL